MLSSVLCSLPLSYYEKENFRVYSIIAAPLKLRPIKFDPPREPSVYKIVTVRY